MLQFLHVLWLKSIQNENTKSNFRYDVKRRTGRSTEQYHAIFLKKFKNCEAYYGAKKAAYGCFVLFINTGENMLRRILRALHGSFIHTLPSLN